MTEQRQRYNTMIPTNGVFVVKTHFPDGFQAARYDAQGFVSDVRWFPALDKAKTYAHTLGRPILIVDAE